MKCLITGGAGFIGSNLADKLIDLGNEVFVIDNLSSGSLDNLNKKAKFFNIDIKDKEKILDLFKTIRFDVVFHLAGQINVRESVNNPVNDAEINILGIINLLEACKECRVTKFIFSSSGGAIYGDDAVIPTSEQEKESPLSPYGIAKLSCEKYLYFYYKQYGIKYIALRYANVYGPKQSPKGEAGVVSIFINKILKNENPIINGDGKQTRDYVYVQDVVNANLLALEKEIIGIFNIGTGVETNVNELFNMIKKEMNSNLEEKHGEAMKGEQLRSCLSYEKARKEIGWKPKVSIEEGIKRTVDWFKQYKSV